MEKEEYAKENMHGLVLEPDVTVFESVLGEGTSRIRDPD